MSLPYWIPVKIDEHIQNFMIWRFRVAFSILWNTLVSLMSRFWCLCLWILFGTSIMAFGRKNHRWNVFISCVSSDAFSSTSPPSACIDLSRWNDQYYVGGPQVRSHLGPVQAHSDTFASNHFWDSWNRLFRSVSSSKADEDRTYWSL